MGAGPERTMHGRACVCYLPANFGCSLLQEKGRRDDPRVVAVSQILAKMGREPRGFRFARARSFHAGTPQRSGASRSDSRFGRTGKGWRAQRGIVLLQALYNTVDLVNR
jgi:hypothetical protein